MTVTGTKPKTAYSGTTKVATDIIGAVWPINEGTKYLCATPDQLAAVPGWTAAKTDKSQGDDS